MGISVVNTYPNLKGERPVISKTHANEAKNQVELGQLLFKENRVGCRALFKG